MLVHALERSLEGKWTTDGIPSDVVVVVFDVERRNKKTLTPIIQRRKVAWCEFELYHSGPLDIPCEYNSNQREKNVVYQSYSMNTSMLSQQVDQLCEPLSHSIHMMITRLVGQLVPHRDMCHPIRILGPGVARTMRVST